MRHACRVDDIQFCESLTLKKLHERRSTLEASIDPKPGRMAATGSTTARCRSIYGGPDRLIDVGPGSAKSCRSRNTRSRHSNGRFTLEPCRMHDGSKSADRVSGIVPNITLRE
jgi:hypothetical protein